MCLLFVRGSVGYFRYSDCSLECRNARQPCTISEVTKDYFPCDCIKTPGECLQMASPFVVCLIANQQPSGGKAIWNDYKKHITPTTPKPPGPNPPTSTPAPNRDLRQKLLEAYAVISTIIMIVYCIRSMFTSIRRWRLERNYSTLSVSAATAGDDQPQPSTSRPYQPTTEPI